MEENEKEIQEELPAEEKEETEKDEVTLLKETVEELRQRFPGEDLSLLLKRRDDEWVKKAKDSLKGNLGRFSHRLEDKRASNKPSELIERALSALRAVDTEQDSFISDPQIAEMVTELNQITYEMRKKLKRG